MIGRVKSIILFLFIFSFIPQCAFAAKLEYESPYEYEEIIAKGMSDNTKASDYGIKYTTERAVLYIEKYYLTDWFIKLFR